MSILDRLNAKSTPWKPAEGDVLTGKVVEVGERDGGFGPYPIVVVVDDDGDEHAVHCFHTVLKNEVSRLRPSVGDEIGFRFDGFAEGEKGAKGYARYRVVLEPVQPRGLAPNWDQHAADAERELEHPGMTVAQRGKAAEEKAAAELEPF